MLFYWDELASENQIWLVGLTIVAALLVAFPFYLFAQSAKSRAIPSQRAFYLGLGIFVSLNAVTQTLWTVDKWLVGALRPSINGEIGGSVLFAFEMIFVGGSPAFNAVLFLIFLWSFVPVCWPIEKYVRNSKRFPATWINLAGAVGLSAYMLVLATALPPAALSADAVAAVGVIMWALVGVGALGTLLFITFAIGFYLALGFKGSGIVRKKSLSIACGFILVFTGLILTQVTAGWLVLLSPATMIAGFALLLAGYAMQRE